MCLANGFVIANLFVLQNGGHVHHIVTRWITYWIYGTNICCQMFVWLGGREAVKTLILMQSWTQVFCVRLWPMIAVHNHWSSLHQRLRTSYVEKDKTILIPFGKVWHLRRQLHMYYFGLWWQNHVTKTLCASFAFSKQLHLHTYVSMRMIADITSPNMH